MATAMKVTLEPERLALRPGESAEVEVSIQNASQVVEHFAASVIGLPRDDLYSVEPAVVMLRPREVGTVRVKLNVPERAGLLAGVYTLGLLVRSPYQQAISRCEELPLDIAPAPALSMAVQPEVVTGGATGTYAVTLGNDGNTALAVTLAGSDPESQVGFDFSPRELFIEPGTMTGAQLVVQATAPLTGQPLRRNLTLRAHAPELTVERQATFLQRPRIAGGLLRVGGMAAGLIMLAGATVGGALLIRDARQPDPPPQASQAAPVATSGPIVTTEAPTTVPPTSGGEPSATPTATDASGLPPGSKLVDFSRLPDGQSPGNRIINGNLYQEDGILLSTVTDRAPPDCRDATALALRTHSAYGSFLTSATPASSEFCNTIPVRIDFTSPTRLVRLNFRGLGAAYTLTVQLSDGSTETREAVSQRDITTPIDYEAPAALTIRSVTFGHSNPDPESKDFTIIKSVAFTTE